MENEQLETLRHSLSHIMTMAVLEICPGAGLGVGMPVENGFYQDYDFDISSGEHKITEEDLPKIEKRMREIIKKKIDFVQTHASFEDAFKFYKNDPYKTELIQAVIDKGEKEASFFDSGDFHNLCKGPHITNSKEIDPTAFKLTKLAGAYWRGDEKNKMLTRIYGVAFATKDELQNYLKMLEEAEKRDHKKLGKEMDLFVFSDLVGSGLPLWTPKGTIMRNLLDNFVWSLRAKYDYEKVEIPHITKKDLYITSGHWDKFKDELFKITTREGHEFAMKPMNCPHHTQVYARKQWSYRDLPQRYANSTACYRDEQSGELAGLSRTRSFTQDDAHVFCREVQVKDEFLKIWDIVHDFYAAFGFELEVRLSLSDPKHMEKYLGDRSRWEKAEGILREIITEKKKKFYEGIGEAAFYGPKLDFMAKDSIGREWQVATIQLDMNMPERFDLFCINENGGQERIVMIHAAIMGSIERFMSIIIEHYAGAFPTWLSPVQVALLPVGSAHVDYCHKLADKFKAEEIRVEVSDENETIGKKIRNAEKQKVPYMLVIGDKEIASGELAIRQRGSSDTVNKKVEEFVEGVKKEIKERR